MGKAKRSITVGSLRAIMIKEGFKSHFILKINKMNNFSIFNPKDNNKYLGYIDLGEEHVVWDGDADVINPEFDFDILI